MSTTERSLKELLSSSGMAFTGTVEATRASTMSALPVDNRTVVVRVGETLHGPEDMRLPPGSQVTVQLSADLPPLRAGDNATFFANGLMYGETLAVAEVGRTGIEQGVVPVARLAGVEAPVSAVSAASAELAQDEAVEHAAAADGIVRGQVTALVAAPGSGSPREHDPQYWIATLAIELVAKADPPRLTDTSNRVEVLYANSIDVQWRESPKPKAGQAGLWLLHATAEAGADLAPFQLLHAIDLQPSIQLNLFRERGI